MAPINTMSVLAFATAAFAVPFHGHGHAKYHNNKPSGFSAYPYPTANGTGLYPTGTGFATGSAIAPASETVVVSDVVSEYETTTEVAATYADATSSCTSDVTVTTTVQKTVTVTPGAASSTPVASSSSSEAAPVESSVESPAPAYSAAPSSEAAPVESSAPAYSEAPTSYSSKAEAVTQASESAPAAYSSPAPTSSASSYVEESSSDASPTMTYSAAGKGNIGINIGYGSSSSSSAAPSSTGSSSSGSSKSGKRGVAYNDAKLTDCLVSSTEVSWGYNWGSSSSGLSDSVQCLKNMPAKTYTDASKYPGVKSRYDEFVATHIENTFKIHATADFLAWHRNFIWEFEQDLKNDCGYTGTLPYWDWAADAQALDKSEVFNGDEYSMGSNGEYIAGRADTYLGLQDLTFPPGTGGGCVYSGPFSNTTFITNLGPIDSPYNDNVQNQMDDNPRCLVRDLNSWFSQRYNTYTNVADLVIGEDSVQYFQALMQGYLGDNKLGVHGGGHWLGGGPSQLEDFHSSPNDPVFFIHHAMIDRLWTVWQYMDRETRQNAIYGTSTLNNSPASADMTLSDSLPFGAVSSNPVFGDLMDTMAGPYCYRYE